jgi:hypothetical protein
LDRVVNILHEGIAIRQGREGIAFERRQELTQLNQQLGALNGQLQNIQRVALSHIRGPSHSPSKTLRDLVEAAGVGVNPEVEFASLFANPDLWTELREADTRSRALAFFQGPDPRLNNPNFTYTTGGGRIHNTPLTLASAIGSYAVETLILASEQPGAIALDPNFQYYEAPLNIASDLYDEAVNNSSSSSSSSSNQRNKRRDNVPSIPEGSMPLTIAIIKKKPDAVMLLLRIGAIVDDEALKAMNVSNPQLTDEEADEFKLHYGAKRVQEDQELIYQEVKSQDINEDDSAELLGMITHINPRDFVDIPRITDHQGLVSACQAIWTRQRNVNFNTWENYVLYKLLVTYYYATSMRMSPKDYPMLNTNSYDPASFLDSTVPVQIDTTKRGRSDLDESLSSLSSSFCRDNPSLSGCFGSSLSSSSGQGVRSSPWALAQAQRAEMMPALAQAQSLTSNSGNEKKLRVSAGPDGNEPGRGPPAQQLQKPPPPDFEDPDACAQYLGFNGGIESIGKISQLHDNVRHSLTLAEGNDEWKDDIRRARDTVHGELEAKGISGGKRRTMKIKKHFRKTNKRVYKKGKKTRVRRNNKSKRVFKEKRRR